MAPKSLTDLTFDDIEQDLDAAVNDADERPAAPPSSESRVPAGGLSDDSSAQGRGLSSATTVYLQAPPPTALPKPEHRPHYGWCPVNNYRAVVVLLCFGGLWVGWVAKNTECFSPSLSASVHYQHTQK